MSNARFSILQARAIGDIRISDAQFRTLAALGMYADKNGWCFPSLKTLGVDLNKSPQAVGRDTIALRKLGYLQVKNRYDSKTKARHSNMYRLLFDFNMDDSTLSTPEVDTLSTPEVEVNVPFNAPKNLGEKSPDLSKMPMDWKLAHGLEITAEDVARMEDDKRRDAANLISIGFGISAKIAFNLAYAFQVARNITFPESKVKGQRKAIKEMLEMHVTPENVTEAVQQLTGKGMTVVDLFSVSKTAIDLANKPKEQYNPNEEHRL